MARASTKRLNDGPSGPGRRTTDSAPIPKASEPETLADLHHCGAEVRKAFARASERLRSNISATELRIQQFAAELAETRSIPEALPLKTQIAACVSEAADANVTIWGELARTVWRGCAGFDQAATVRVRRGRRFTRAKSRLSV